MTANWGTSAFTEYVSYYSNNVNCFVVTILKGFQLCVINESDITFWKKMFVKTLISDFEEKKSIFASSPTTDNECRHSKTFPVSFLKRKW